MAYKFQEGGFSPAGEVQVYEKVIATGTDKNVSGSAYTINSSLVVSEDIGVNQYANQYFAGASDKPFLQMFSGSATTKEIFKASWDESEKKVDVQFKHYPGGGGGTLKLSLKTMKHGSTLESQQSHILMNNAADAQTILIGADPAGLVTAGSFVSGKQYKIITPGTTNFTLIGAANSNAGTVFTATGAGANDGTADRTFLRGSMSGSGNMTIGGNLTVTGSGGDVLVHLAGGSTFAGTTTSADVQTTEIYVKDITPQIKSGADSLATSVNSGLILGKDDADGSQIVYSYDVNTPLQRYFAFQAADDSANMSVAGGALTGDGSLLSGITTSLSHGYAASYNSLVAGSFCRPGLNVCAAVSGQVTVKLPPTSFCTIGSIVRVKLLDTGASTTNKLTIDKGHGGDSIDGENGISLMSDGASVDICYVSANNWAVL